MQDKSDLDGAVEDDEVAEEVGVDDDYDDFDADLEVDPLHNPSMMRSHHDHDHDLAMMGSEMVDQGDDYHRHYQQQQQQQRQYQPIEAVDPSPPPYNEQFERFLGFDPNKAVGNSGGMSGGVPITSVGADAGDGGTGGVGVDSGGRESDRERERERDTGPGVTGVEKDHVAVTGTGAMISNGQ